MDSYPSTTPTTPNYIFNTQIEAGVNPTTIAPIPTCGTLMSFPITTMSSMFNNIQVNQNLPATTLGMPQGAYIGLYISNKSNSGPNPGWDYQVTGNAGHNSGKGSLTSCNGVGQPGHYLWIDSSTNMNEFQYASNQTNTGIWPGTCCGNSNSNGYNFIWIDNAGISAGLIRIPYTTSLWNSMINDPWLMFNSGGFSLNETGLTNCTQNLKSPNGGNVYGSSSYSNIVSHFNIQDLPGTILNNITIHIGGKTMTMNPPPCFSGDYVCCSDFPYRLFQISGTERLMFAFDAQVPPYWYVKRVRAHQLALFSLSSALPIPNTAGSFATIPAWKLVTWCYEATNSNYSGFNMFCNGYLYNVDNGGNKQVWLYWNNKLTWVYSSTGVNGNFGSNIIDNHFNTNSSNNVDGALLSPTSDIVSDSVLIEAGYMD